MTTQKLTEQAYHLIRIVDLREQYLAHENHIAKPTPNHGDPFSYDCPAIAEMEILRWSTPANDCLSEEWDSGSIWWWMSIESEESFMEMMNYV